MGKVVNLFDKRPGKAKARSGVASCNCTGHATAMTPMCEVDKGAPVITALVCPMCATEYVVLGGEIQPARKLT